MVWKRIPIYFLCLSSLLSSCNNEESPRGLAVGLGGTISNGTNSYSVSSVTWSSDFISFVTELSFHEVHIAESWYCQIYYGLSYGLDSFSCPFNRTETNRVNEIQISDDGFLSIDGPYTFVLDQVLESPTAFIENENSYIELFLFIVQADYQNSWAWIQNEVVNFITEQIGGRNKVMKLD
jgi:hypothetical protein